ncbi:MAG: hypothetical protein IT291_00445 [Deltaproteobacteria bacterium]|nr:hypothetical protein [Deltaproteobacteria bacterium]
MHQLVMGLEVGVMRGLGQVLLKGLEHCKSLRSLSLVVNIKLNVTD